MSRSATGARSSLWLVLAASAAAGQVFGQARDGESTFQVECPGGYEFNARAEESVCLGVRMTDGTNTISADEARTLNNESDDGVWQLNGNVRIAFDTTEITAGRASFEFADGELVFGELIGTPVVMTDQVEDRPPLSATAEKLTVDKRTSVLRLDGESTLIQGGNEIKGCNLVYDLDEKSFRFGTSETCGAVMRVTPTKDSEASGDQTAPP